MVVIIIDLQMGFLTATFEDVRTGDTDFKGATSTDIGYLHTLFIIIFLPTAFIRLSINLYFPSLHLWFNPKLDFNFLCKILNLVRRKHRHIA